MALIKCPECEKVISDKASVCPHCGNPIAQSIENTKSSASTAHIINMVASDLKCPGCGATLGSKDVLTSGWVKCSQCGEEFVLNGTNELFNDDKIIEKLFRFNISDEDFHKKVMWFLLRDGKEDVFETMNNIAVKRKFIWVREFGRGKNRYWYPMSQYGKELFKQIWKKPYASYEEFNRYFPAEEAVNFNANDIRGAEIIAKEMSAAEVRMEFSHLVEKTGTTNTTQIKNFFSTPISQVNEISSAEPTPYYYCLPIYEETFDYKGKQYYYQGIGLREQERYYVWSIPKEDMLSSGPNWYKKQALTTFFDIVGVLILLIILIVIFDQHGFWWGIGAFIISGIPWGIVELIIGITIVPIDKIIIKSINYKRKASYMKEFERIQSHKKQSLLANQHIDLQYNTPKYNIPSADITLLMSKLMSN